jgi:membrane protein DedA with SNARE-associated domain
VRGVDDTIPQLLSDYGYLAVFVGALLEGESVLMLAGYAAHRGLLSLPTVVVIAFFGATLGDQMFFLIGRRFGRELVVRWPGFEERTVRVERLLLRYHAWVIMGVRFAYGLRIAGPIAIGMSALPAWRFFLFNAIGAVVWAPLIAGVGWMFGHALEQILGDMRRYEALGLALLVVAIVAVTMLTHAARRRRR